MAGTENFCQTAESTPPPEVDLKEAIACGIDALHEECIFRAVGVDMRDPPSVDEHFGWLAEATELYGFCRLPGNARRPRDTASFERRSDK
jgi:hypothetical protein